MRAKHLAAGIALLPVIIGSLATTARADSVTTFTIPSGSGGVLYSDKYEVRTPANVSFGIIIPPPPGSLPILEIGTPAAPVDFLSSAPIVFTFTELSSGYTGAPGQNLFGMKIGLMEIVKNDTPAIWTTFINTLNDRNPQLEFSAAHQGVAHFHDVMPSAPFDTVNDLPPNQAATNTISFLESSSTGNTVNNGGGKWTSAAGLSLHEAELDPRTGDGKCKDGTTNCRQFTLTMAPNPSDSMTVIDSGGVAFACRPIQEGREAVCSLPIGKVPAGTSDIDLVLMDPSGEASDVVSLIVDPLGRGVINFTSDTDGALIVPAGAKQIVENKLVMDLTKDLFPAGSGKIVVKVASDANVPEPCSVLLLASGLIGLVRLRSRFRT